MNVQSQAVKTTTSICNCFPFSSVLFPQSFTFTGAGSDKSRCFSQFVVDLHISTKHNKSFDQLYMVQLMNKVTHSHSHRSAVHLRQRHSRVSDICGKGSSLRYNLHSEVQGCVSILSLQVGICSVGEQHHGCLETALLGHDVERAFSSFTEVVDFAAVLQQQATHLDYIYYTRRAILTLLLAFK